MLTERDLEDYIDEHGVAKLLGMIVNVCAEKADHVQDNWQDRTMARAWREGAALIEDAAEFEDWPL